MSRIICGVVDITHGHAVLLLGRRLFQIEGITTPLNFIIDTGASISVVSEQQLAAGGDISRFVQSSRTRIFGAAGVAEDVKVLMPPRVALGPYARESVALAVLDLRPINETTGFEQAGILGGNFLRHFRVTLDLEKSVLQLEPLTGPAGEETPPNGTSASGLRANYSAVRP